MASDLPNQRIYLRAQSLFLDAYSLSPNEREARLQRAIETGDGEAVSLAREMLLAHESSPDETRASMVESAEHRLRVGLLPDRIDAYEVQGVVGEGGMGRVLLGVDNQKKRVAIKVLQSGLIGEAVVRRFDREIVVLQSLNHPGIVRFLGAGRIGEDPTQRYLLMEYVEGSSLLDHVERFSLSDTARLHLLKEVCEAVGYAHAHKVVHRDLKPNNILVTSEGEPKVLDFGLARVVKLDTEVTQATKSGMLMGTVRYMSPEQARGSTEEIGPPADVYALGVLGYEMLAGRLPYSIEGDETLARVLFAIYNDEPTSLTVHRPELPERLNRVFAKALSKEPKDRYVTAGQLAEDIGRLLRGESVVAPKPRRKSPQGLWTWAARAAVVTLVVAAAGLIFVALQRNLEQKRLLQSAFASLSVMEEHRHPKPADVGTTRMMISLLQDASSDLSKLPPDDFVGHLLRFTKWRLGECNLFLFQSLGDARYLEQSRELWSQAINLPFDYKIGEKLHPSLGFRYSIVHDPEETPLTGVLIASTELAALDRPLPNLARLLIANQNLTDRQEQPVQNRFTEEALRDHEDHTRSHLRGLRFHDHARFLLKVGAVADSLQAIEEGLRYLSRADTVQGFGLVTGPYRAFLLTRGNAYIHKARITREVADADSALWRLRQARSYADPDQDPAYYGAVHKQIAEALVLRSTIADPAESNRDLRRARTSLDIATAVPPDSSDFAERIRLAILESSWNRAVVSTLGGGHYPGKSQKAAALEAASLWVAEAEQALEGFRYPVPKARVQLESARIAVAEAEVFAQPDRWTAAEEALQACEVAIPRTDWPAYHRETTELRRRLDKAGGRPDKTF